ncbi:MAG: hydroxyacid dehydrogenase [Nanoarchaeota archaeon]|nr:MAG: hydroxyacid dehydrogenase [Nanoarchaeota archaeon]
MKVAFFEVNEWEPVALRKSFSRPVIESREIQNALGKAKNCGAISVFVNSRVSKEILQKLPRLKLIATRSTGFDHIDMDYCKKRNIKVCNVPSYGKHTVAEHAFALLLTLSRKMEQAVKSTRAGKFDPSGLTGFDLCGKTIGVIGTGSIGVHSIQIACGFGMNVIAYDAYPNKSLAKNFKYVSLPKLLSQSDIVTIHLPLLKNTFHLLNKKNLSRMKKGAILINTSRGALVDTDALVDSLKKGNLAGAGLDVLEEELIMKDESTILYTKFTPRQLRTAVEEHALLQMENVIITPHNAFNTKEALARIMSQTIENIKSFQKGKLINEVN